MNNQIKKKESILRNNGFQTIIASLLCIIIGLLIGYIVLLIINPSGAGEAITAILKNFFYYPSEVAVKKYFGTTLVKASALLMCSLSVLFAYKVGLFNIGAAGQYVIGAGACLYFGLQLKMPWYVCLIAAVVSAAIVGGISGLLKAYFNVNEVISCIMLNWIGLYSVNMLLTKVKDASTPYTKPLSSTNKNALLPNAGLDKLFANNEFVTIGLVLSVVMAIVVWVILEKTKFGYGNKERNKEKFKTDFFLLLTPFTTLKDRNSLRSNNLPFLTLRYGCSLNREKSRSENLSACKPMQNQKYINDKSRNPVIH